MTPAERILWAQLRAPAFKPFHLRRQTPIGPWFADFLSHRAKLVIEIDGDTHLRGQDRVRDAAMLELGFETIRFSNADVHENPDGVSESILGELSLRYQPHPDPPRTRGGGT